MACNLIFSVLAVSVVVMARPEGPKGGPPRGGPGGHGGHGGPPGGPRGPHGDRGLPPFLFNLTSEAKKEFLQVFRNENLTISESETQVAALAEKYGVSDIYKEFQANITSHLEEVKKNQTAVISNLESVSSKLAAIYANKDQTRAQQREAAEAVRKENPVEVDTIRFIRSQSEGGPRRGPHGPRGGPHGGPRGGPRGGPKGGKPRFGKKEESAESSQDEDKQ